MRGGRRWMRSRSRAPALTTGQAIALGALHGPAELMPVSSSAHVALVPWLLGWEYTRLDGELRKSFEVALHAGTAAGLMTTVRGRAVPRWTLLAIATAPAALAGLALERPVERRLGTPRTIAAGLIAGGAAMAAADRAPERRGYEDAAPRDALWLGIAQAAALFPGVSRSGATLAAARLRGFTRPASERLSREAALPVIAGATALKALRLRRRRLDPGVRAPFVAGSAAAFVSTLAAGRAIGHPDAGRSLNGYAAYRAALAAVALSCGSRRDAPAPGSPRGVGR